MKKETKTNISKIALHVKNISSDKKSSIFYTLLSRLNKKTAIKLDGIVVQKPLNINSKIEVKNINLTDFSDANLPFPFHTNIHDLNDYITTLDFNSTTPSKIKLDGKIDKYGYAYIKGVLLSFKIKQKADIDVLLKNINLTSLTPYSGKFLGYKIKNGKLSMDLNYKISKASLVGKNKINIDTLDLGESVKSKKTKAKTEKILDITAFNTQMYKELSQTIKITKDELISLANKRANVIRDILIKRYKIDKNRLKILPPKAVDAKRDRWVKCGLKISI